MDIILALIILYILFIAISLFIMCIGLTMAAKSSEEISEKFADKSLEIKEEENK